MLKTPLLAGRADKQVVQSVAVDVTRAGHRSAGRPPAQPAQHQTPVADVPKVDRRARHERPKHDIRDTTVLTWRRQRRRRTDDHVVVAVAVDITSRRDNRGLLAVRTRKLHERNRSRLSSGGRGQHAHCDRNYKSDRHSHAPTVFGGHSRTQPSTGMLHA